MQSCKMFAHRKMKLKRRDRRAVGESLATVKWTVQLPRKCLNVIPVQQPPMRRLQDLGLEEGLEAFAQTAKALNFLPRYENVKEFAIQLVQDDWQQADLFYHELLHSVGPAEHPLRNIADSRTHLSGRGECW